MLVCLIALGCPKNIVEGEGLAAIIRKAGHVLTTDVSKADAAIVHTCSFVHDAKEESWSFINRLVELKKSGRLKKIVVTGCMAQELGKAICEKSPGIDAVVGTGKLNLVAKALEKDEPFVSCKAPGGLLEAKSGRILSSALPSAYIRIAEGCDHKCSFCVIPSLRGAYHSRSIASIVREATALARAGIAELNIVAQDTTVFGRGRAKKLQLSQLLKQLGYIDGLRWIRLMYAYPNSVNDNLLKAFSVLQKICNYIDLPLQHASDAVLRRMGRPLKVRSVVERIAQLAPGISIRTAFIVGFPGETERDFAKLCDFVKEGWFEHVGVFEYSDNEKTPAHNLKPKVPPQTARRRRRELLRIQNDVVKKRNRTRIGKVFETLIEGRVEGKEQVWHGRTAFQAPEVDSIIECRGPARAGQFVNVRVSSIKGLNLCGEIV